MKRNAYKIMSILLLIAMLLPYVPVNAATIEGASSGGGRHSSSSTTGGSHSSGSSSGGSSGSSHSSGSSNTNGTKTDGTSKGPITGTIYMPLGPARVELDGNFDVHLLTDITTYTPKVTMVHNINAMCAAYAASDDPQGCNPVYYIPTTEELPFDLKEYVQTSLVDNEGKKHTFAAVYDGFFDAEAKVQSNWVNGKEKSEGSIVVEQGTNVDSNGNIGHSDESQVVAYASKDVATRNVSHPALKSIGYDLLLSEEKYKVQNKDGDLYFTNDYTPVTNVGDKSGKSMDVQLSYETAVMDIYKSLGAYEYFLTAAFIQDKGWDTDNEPILSEISVNTSAKGTDGLDVSESYCGLAVSRTHPDLYMKRLIKDGIAVGAMDQKTNPSEILHSGECFSDKNYKLSFIEFCRVLIPLMNLYGEETISDADLKLAEKVYCSELATLKNTSETDRNLIIWMLAKGLIDGEQLRNIDLDSKITLLSDDIKSGNPKGNYIIDILSRVKDPDRRVKYSLSKNIDPKLSAMGYGTTKVNINENIVGYSEMPTSATTVYDYLVEYNKYTKYKVTVKEGNSSENTDTSSSRYSTDGIRLYTVGNGNHQAPEKQLDSDFYKANDNYNPDEDVTKLVKDSDEVAKGYHFYGIIDLGGKQYYHFKVGKQLAQRGIKIGYYVEDKYKKIHHVARKNKYRTATNGFVELGEHSTEGGLFNIVASGDSYKAEHSSFEELNSTDYFIDASAASRYHAMLADNYTTFVIYMKPKAFDNLKNDTVNGLMWEQLKEQSGELKNGRTNISNEATRKVYVYIPELDAGSEFEGKVRCYRVEIITNDPDTVRDSDFIQNKSITTETEGYYRHSDKNNSLLVSFSYLKEKGLVTALRQMADDKNTWVLTTGQYNSNVVMRKGADDKPNLLFVGDVLYVLDHDEALIETINGEKFINYRACMGWGGDFALVSGGDSPSASVMPFTEYGIGDNDFTQSIKEVSLASGMSGQIKVCYNTVKMKTKHDKVEFKGIPLTTSYALSPYLVVVNQMKDSKDIDLQSPWLFVYHRNNVKTSDDSEHNVPVHVVPGDTNSKTVVELFNALTMNSVPLKQDKDKKKGYRMVAYKLDTNDNHNNPKGISYVKASQVTRSGTMTASMGFWWDPPEYDDAQKALDDYAKSCKPSETDLILPIAWIKFSETTGKFIDCNLNLCSKDEGSSFVQVGTLPCYYNGASADNKTKAVMQSNGCLRSANSSKETNNYITYSAPVSIFASLKGMGALDIKKIQNKQVYFGTTKCDYKNGKILLNNHETAFDKDDKAICTYLGSGNSTVYAVTLGGTSIGGLLSALNDEVEYLINDPGSLVDWGQFKFQRLIQHMDAWSTVVLIFVLNILPRVCLLLFFILMLLSLIKDNKIWQIICHKYFDLYSFLSFGKYTVDNISTKNTVITSLICSSLFIIIMDGQLFNFIIWVCKFFIALYQR